LVIGVAITDQDGDRFCLALMIMEAEGQRSGPFEGVSVGSAVFVRCLTGVVDAVRSGDDDLAPVPIDSQPGAEPEPAILADDQLQATENAATKSIAIQEPALIIEISLLPL
jgi:hypothetical protein